MASVLGSILNAVQSKIQGLALTGIESANVVVRQVATERGLTYPATGGMVLIAPAPNTVTPGVGVLKANDKTYSIIVAFLAKDNQATAVTDARFSWEESVYSAFHNKRLSGVASVYSIQVSPGDAVDRQGWDANRFVGLQVLKVTSREARGD